ncbi:MAG: LysM peptidoglycan-binding domain-containing protein [Chloroflexota bacterium]|nr:LysM peptidoglycan-binding domain-containing protein [Chloroflexota bacterium]
MTKRLPQVIVCVVLLALVLTGCKMPASKAPATETEQAMTTPIRLQTNSPEEKTQTAVSKGLSSTATTIALAPTATNTPEPTEVIIIPTVTRPAEYTVQEGEFPYCIARRFNLNPADLISVNGLGEGEIVSPGTTLQIPQTGSWTGEGRVRNPHPDTYTVSAGDTVYSIACFYGDVSPEAIIAVNNLEEPYTLTAGQTLDIP